MATVVNKEYTLEDLAIKVIKSISVGCHIAIVCNNTTDNTVWRYVRKRVMEHFDSVGVTDYIHSSDIIWWGEYNVGICIKNTQKHSFRGIRLSSSFVIDVNNFNELVEDITPCMQFNNGCIYNVHLAEK
jgi:hypothetical protein